MERRLRGLARWPAMRSIKLPAPTIGTSLAVAEVYPVVTARTLGMMLANIPAVLLGNKVADKLPVTAIRITAAVVFAILGLLTLTGVGK
jgi:Ca2+/H+ antiporter, TMEM165/GDT1 family